jgi:hypothetical protein
MEQNFCDFLDPRRINDVSLDIAPQQAIDYMCDSLLLSQAQNKPFVLTPVFEKSVDYTYVYYYYILYLINLICWLNI